jgi:dUTP pyrophosphatase
MENQNDLELSNEELDALKNFIDNEDSQYEDIESILQNMLGLSPIEYEDLLDKAMKTKTLGYKKLSPDAVDPSYNYDKDSGFDLYAIEDVALAGMSRAMVGTGLAFDIPDGYEIQVRPKSGLAINYGLTVLNTPSTIDGGYVGEVKVILFNTSRETYQVKKGMKIAQAVLCPVQQGKYVNLENLDELPDTDRGDNGFGSTGLN